MYVPPNSQMLSLHVLELEKMASYCPAHSPVQGRLVALYHHCITSACAFHNHRWTRGEALCDLLMQDVSGAMVNGIIVHNYSVSPFHLKAILLAH